MLALVTALWLPLGAVVGQADAAPGKPPARGAAPPGKSPQRAGKAKTERGGKPAKRARAKPGKAPKGKRGHGRVAQKPKARAPGSEPGTPDEATRQIVTGQHPNHSSAKPTESPELKAMREADKVLFPSKPAPAGAPWPVALNIASETPKVQADGLPPAATETAPEGRGAKESAPPKKDLSWLGKLTKPDFPVRYEPSVVRYLEYYKDNPRGKKLLAAFVRKSGRYRDAVRKVLRQHKLPEDLLWLAAVESAFNPLIHSHAGAAGLWQFVPATGRVYGLTITRSVDERLDPERATTAAVKHLKDLYRRFGTWELAFAAYNMGYGGLLASIRKFNTNDFWELRRLEAGLPYETALYVPKIMAIAIASRNCKVFGCDGVQVEAAAPFAGSGGDTASVAPGVTIKEIAAAAGIDEARLAALNPHIIGQRLPPLEHSTLARTAWTVYLPQGAGPKVAAAIPSAGAAARVATYQVRWGEDLDHVAARFSTSGGWLTALNDLYPQESPRPGTTIFVPAGRTPKSDAEVLAGDGAPRLVVVPESKFSYPDRRRVFYQAVFGDTIEDVARVCGVLASEVKRWNHLDPRATLQDGMKLQLYLPSDKKPASVVLLEDTHVRVVKVESRPFFRHFVTGQGRKRIEVTVREGDTWRTLAKRYGLTLGMLERINHKSRRSKLSPGDKVVVYAKYWPAEQSGTASAATAKKSDG